jgi:hypothetical protein
MLQVPWKNLKSAPAKKKTGITYDAKAVSDILGTKVDCGGTPPEPEEGEVIVAYGGWNLAGLSELAAAKGIKLPSTQAYNMEPGYYRVMVLVPHTNNRGWPQQIEYLKWIDERWNPYSLIVVLTALITHFVATKKSLLEGHSSRSAPNRNVEPGDIRLHGDKRIGLQQLHHYCMPEEVVWLAASQRCEVTF